MCAYVYALVYVPVSVVSTTRKKIYGDEHGMANDLTEMSLLGAAAVVHVNNELYWSSVRIYYRISLILLSVRLRDGDYVIPSAGIVV